MKYFRSIVTIFLLHCIILLVDIVFPLVTIRKAIEYILTPVQEGLYEVTIKTVRFSDFIFTLDDVYQDNENLREDLNRLFALQVENERLREENKLLRAQSKVALQSEAPLLLGKVIGINSSSHDVQLLLDVGLNQGVATNMFAISEKTIIGRVTQVGETRSLILPTLAVSSKIPVEVVDDDGVVKTQALVQGAFNLRAELSQAVNQDAKIEDGDLVITSGIEGTYPKGFVVGRVTEVKYGQNNVFQSARVELPWELSKIKFVFVLEPTNVL